MNQTSVSSWRSHDNGQVVHTRIIHVAVTVAVAAAMAVVVAGAMAGAMAGAVTAVVAVGVHGRRRPNHRHRPSCVWYVASMSSYHRHLNPSAHAESRHTSSHRRCPPPDKSRLTASIDVGIVAAIVPARRRAGQAILTVGVAHLLAVRRPTAVSSESRGCACMLPQVWSRSRVIVIRLAQC